MLSVGPGAWADNFAVKRDRSAIDFERQVVEHAVIRQRDEFFPNFLFQWTARGYRTGDDSHRRKDNREDQSYDSLVGSHFSSPLDFLIGRFSMPGEIIALPNKILAISLTNNCNQCRRAPPWIHLAGFQESAKIILEVGRRLLDRA